MTNLSFRITIVCEQPTIINKRQSLGELNNAHLIIILSVHT